MGIFRAENNNIVLDAPYCEFYIPKQFFDSTKHFAEDYSDTIKVLGIFNVGLFENNKLVDIKIMNAPIMLTINVYDSEWREISFGNGTSEMCKVCKYVKDQILFPAIAVKESINAEMFLNAIISGSLPSNIPYTKAISMWMKNTEISGVNFGVPSTMMELILSVCFRDKHHPENKFSKRYGKDLNCNEMEYATASIRQICQYASTFSSIIYEDFDSMVTSSINRAREGKAEAETPLENLIKM